MEWTCSIYCSELSAPINAWSGILCKVIRLKPAGPKYLNFLMIKPLLNCWETISVQNTQCNIISTLFSYHNLSHLEAIWSTVSTLSLHILHFLSPCFFSIIFLIFHFCSTCCRADIKPSSA